MTTVVLVHGAFRGGWSWEPTRRELDTRGVATVAPDLPNAGARYRPGHPVVDLPTAARDLGRVVADVAGPVALVGHSQGSLVVRALLGDAASAAAVVAVGHLDGAVPDAGERAVDLLGGAPGIAPDLVVAPPPPEPSLPLAVRDVIAGATVPQHAAIALDPVPPLAVEVATHWAFCRATPDGYPSTVVRRRLEGRGVAHTWLDAPHDAPLTHPGTVADWVVGWLPRH